jgi:hypothetical protein
MTGNSQNWAVIFMEHKVPSPAQAAAQSHSCFLDPSPEWFSRYPERNRHDQNDHSECLNAALKELAKVRTGICDCVSLLVTVAGRAGPLLTQKGSFSRLAFRKLKDEDAVV